MATITVEPATSDRFDDAEHALTGGGDGRSCQCQWWTIPNAEFQKLSIAEREALLRNELDAGPPPALIAYVDRQAAGWVRVGPRTAQVRIGRTREIVGATAQPLDDPSVWSVSCFVVRREHRGRGLNAALLEAAIDHARARGARVIEAYPLDPTAAKHSSNELYRGVLSVFLAAGFTEVARPRADRAIVQLELT
ncbi:MAG TPA: GNAT family N-acetyltransferase [Microbacterium sp.]|uniref:GNAT family N-acetyltransferase n=1 Tax=Microbacterium sp. TaxID=51671 RepID=UPI002C6523BA|nr:GNAT family N-acetyltransferase [Microbacterium sp.]HWI31774.1 GNAT family N-acetyltransferase [Microbacterium sp.]